LPYVINNAINAHTLSQPLLQAASVETSSTVATIKQKKKKQFLG
jgi:hypothetical protein